MSRQAIELEIERVNGKASRYRLLWVSCWTGAAISALPLLFEGTQHSEYLWVFLFLAVAAIVATFYLQHIYFQAARKRQHLVTELLQTRGRA